ncbi:MAG: HD domain-containing protein [Thermodesulfobacteriota bacterium]|nr:HD domain-containing protein [Thermodesulfobacteriota bacterium]
MDIKALTGSFILKNAYSTSKELGVSIFLVGGAIRDLVLFSQLERDFDFAIKGDVHDAAMYFAKRVRGSSYCLDSKRGHYRVTIKGNTQSKDVDFSRFQGDEIKEDLLKRDFTLNSMAIDLKGLFEKSEIKIIDPLNGLGDIERGIIRACSPRVFDEDPLRLLRAVRLSAATDFFIVDETERLIREKKKQLSCSSWERIRDELFQIFDLSNVSRSIEMLDGLGLLNIILPEVDAWKHIDQGEYHDYNLFDHSLKTIESIDLILSSPSDYLPGCAYLLKAHFKEDLQNNITRENLIKFIALLHDSGKVETQTFDGKKVRFFGHERVGQKINRAIAERFKLSQRSSRIVANLTKNHMRVLNLSKSSRITQRAMYRFFNDLGKDGIDCLILSLADALATREYITYKPTLPLLDVIEELLKYYSNDWMQASEKPLLNGTEIMELLRIPQGEEVGRLLSLLKEAQTGGGISTKEEAKNLLYLDGFLNRMNCIQ